MTVTVCPATVSPPVREGPSVLAIVNVTTPVPLLPEPEAIVIHGALLDAVHSQPAAAVTLTVRDPPLASAE